MRATVTIASLVVLAALAVTGFVLHRANGRLAAEATSLHRRAEPLKQQATENERTRRLLARAESDADAAAREIQAEVQRLRDEAHTLESRAHDVAAQKAATLMARAMNRDPERDFAPLENFQNVGRATPSAAVQTMIWSVLKPDESALLAAISLNDSARAAAQRLLARLPDSEREKYPTPEAIAALAVSTAVMRADAAQIASTTPIDSQHATVLVRLPDSTDTAKVPTELGTDGWRIVVEKKWIDAMERSPVPLAPPSKG